MRNKDTDAEVFKTNQTIIYLLIILQALILQSLKSTLERTFAVQAVRTEVTFTAYSVLMT